MIDSLLDALGYVGDALDKPGRAVRGLLAGNTGEGLAAVPFSDSLGLTDPSQRTSGKDLLRALGADPGDGLGGTLAGIGTELATDPLTWLGGGAGRLLGGRASEAALARGPRYGTTADDLGRMVGDFTAANPDAAAFAGRRWTEFGRSPAADRILSEIPEGSKVLGAGAEGMAFGAPSGDVVRIGRVGAGEPGRPSIEGLLQPRRTTDIPSNAATSYRSELLPHASMVGDPAMAGRLTEIDQALSRSGASLGDRHLGNVGMLGDTPLAIDPGAVELAAGFGGPRQAVATAGQPGRPMNLLLDLLGADEQVRRGLPSFAPGLMRAGAMGGAGTGILGRTFGSQ